MSTPERTAFHTDAEVALPALAHAAGCACRLHARRRWGTAALATLAAPGVWAQGAQQDWLQQPGGPATAAAPSATAQNWDECKRSSFTKVASAGQVEQAATQQYAQMLQQASSKKALGPQNHPQVQLEPHALVTRLRIYPDGHKSMGDRAAAWRASAQERLEPFPTHPETAPAPEALDST